eukprot:TRINITY_DN2251_c0_g2_i1.p1 TRINITY_DN2251_c0_g2~~TRINITY_DN2251_c0_g2_i1.p1  ORF type:complete len:311 (-),score=60.93 TRINITY_DN2251_c0_g2_i1:996-1814(-)
MAGALQPAVLHMFDPATLKPKPLRPLVEFLERERQAQQEREAQRAQQEREQQAQQEREAQRAQQEWEAQRELEKERIELEKARLHNERRRVVRLQPQPGGTLADGEGLAISERIKTSRIATCQNLVAKAFADGPLLVRAPPFCGKTSLALTLLPWVAGKQAMLTVFPFTMLCANKEDKAQVAAFIDEARAPSDRRYLLVVDEVQLSYSEPASPLWSAVKLMKQILRRTGTLNFSAILFGTYGVNLMPEATPVSFDSPNTLFLQNVLFSEDEM